MGAERVWDNLQFYALHGAGGDGGVEALPYWRMALCRAPSKVVPREPHCQSNKADLGFYYYHETRYPNLVRYVVTMPTNLTSAGSAPKRGGRRGRPQKEVSSAGKSWLTGLLLPIRGLCLSDGTSKASKGQLDLEANHELYAAWFSGTFLSFSELHLTWEKARGRLRDRYLPDLHAAGAMGGSCSDLFEPSWVHSTRCVADARAVYQGTPYCGGHAASSRTPG